MGQDLLHVAKSLFNLQINVDIVIESVYTK